VEYRLTDLENRFSAGSKGLQRTAAIVTDQRPRILIVRLSAIGDCVLTVPLVHAIRQRYPDAYIAWIAEERAAPLLEGLRGLDELLVVPRKWLRSLRTVLRIRRELRDRRFEIAIDPQSLTESGLLSLFSGAKQRICFGPPDGRELAPMLGNCQVQARGEHLVDRTLELLQPLGIEHAEVSLNCRVIPDQNPSSNLFIQILVINHSSPS
jgi:ADP-heptose:LPS heptosyltransferase